MKSAYTPPYTVSIAQEDWEAKEERIAELEAEVGRLRGSIEYTRGQLDAYISHGAGLADLCSGLDELEAALAPPAPAGGGE